MKISHPSQHIELEPLNKRYEALDQFLQDGFRKTAATTDYSERQKIISLKDQLQDIMIKFRIQNTDNIKYLIGGK